jgi:hypothetical protein
MKPCSGSGTGGTQYRICVACVPAVGNDLIRSLLLQGIATVALKIAIGTLDQGLRNAKASVTSHNAVGRGPGKFYGSEEVRAFIVFRAREPGRRVARVFHEKMASCHANGARIT